MVAALPTTPLRHNLEFPTIRDMITIEIATTMYESPNGLAPEYIILIVQNSFTRLVNFIFFRSL